MKKGFLITSLSLAAIALVSCATSNINSVAVDSSNTTSTSINDNGSNAVTKVEVEIWMNGGKYDGEEYCNFSVRPGTIWKTVKENVDISKIQPIDEYHEFKMFSFLQYEDSEIDDSYVIEDDFRAYVRYQENIRPEDQCTVNWLNDDMQPLAPSEVYGKGETPVYKGPTPVHSRVPGHEFYFLGWEPKLKPLESDATYVAQYFDVTKEHTVKFDYQYDSIVKSVVVKHGDKVEEIIPSRTGWTFGGWYETTEFIQEFDFNTPIESDIVLYAKWTQDERVVTFYSDYLLETVWRTVTVKYGEKVVPPESPTKEHFDFNMWVDSNYVQFDFNTAIVENINLYATYIPSLYTITFDMNGAPSYIEPITISYLEPVSLPTPEKWDGHTFNGWKYNGRIIEDPEHFMVEADTTLVASWTQKTCTVTFDWEDDQPSTEIKKVVNYGERVAPMTPTYEGHTFRYWSADWISPSPFNFDTPITEDIELYAIWDDIYFTVTFSCNGGHFPGGSSTTTTRSVKYSETIPDISPFRPDDPVRDGYTFSGWYDSNGNEFEFGITILATRVYSDMDVHATWDKASDRTVDFYVDGDLYASKKVGYGEKVSRPDDPSKPGYQFEAWYEDGEKFNFDTAITKDHDLYAVWSDPESCTVTFIANGGTPAPNPQTVSYGGTISEPPQMTRDGYDFGGWFKEPNFSGSQYNFDTPVNDSFILYAKWDEVGAIPVHFVDYDSSEQIVNVPYGQRVIPVDPKPNPGHIFEGWYKGETEFDFDTPIIQETTLVAKWSGEVEKCTVTFVANGGTPAVTTETVDYGQTVQEPSEPEREGYDFDGWYTDQETTEENKYDFSTPVESSFNLYAGWTPVGALTVTFYTAVGERYLDPVTVEYGGLVTRPEDPTKEGHDFLGWYDNSAFTGEPFSFSTPITKNLDLYAKWSGIEQCTVTFVGNGGSPAIMTQTINYGETMQAPSEPIHEGYDFEGWYTDQELTSKFTFPATITSSFNLYANWTPVAEIPVHFVNYDSSEQIKYVPYGQKVLPIAPKDKEGYTFLGWYKDQQGTTEFDFETPIKEATTIYAIWSEEKIDCVVTFISNGGSAVEPSSVTVKYDETISAPESPTRYGYTFLGWYTDHETFDEEHKYDFNTKVESSFNLYAGWAKKDDCTVTFMDGIDPFYTVTVSFGDKVIPADPTKEGYTFLGWYKDEQGTELFNFENTRIEEDTYIYGKWEEIPPTPTDEITVTFNPNGGTYVPSVTIEPGSTIAEAPECIREGYKLDGWYYTKSGLETKFVFGETTLESDTMLTAKWIELSRGALINLNGEGEDVRISVGANYDPRDPSHEYYSGEIFYFDFDDPDEQYFNIHTADGFFLPTGKIYGVYINGAYYEVFSGSGQEEGVANYDKDTGTLYLPSEIDEITTFMVAVNY